MIHIYTLYTYTHILMPILFSWQLLFLYKTIWEQKVVSTNIRNRLWLPPVVLLSLLITWSTLCQPPVTSTRINVRGSLILVCYMKYRHAQSPSSILLLVFSQCSASQSHGGKKAPPASYRLVDRACGISQRPPHACFLLWCSRVHRPSLMRPCGSMTPWCPHSWPKQRRGSPL